MGKYHVYVYAICKDEEKFVSRWMESMGEADAVYVLDTGSKDGTAAALREAGAIVESRAINPWRFDTARNESLEMVPADADICVCTDLDEVFRPGWRQGVEAALDQGADQLRYKYVWSYTPEGREGTVFYADKMHARTQFKWVGPVHEVLRYTGEKPLRRVLCEDVQLDHYPDENKSRGQYLPLLELAVKEEPDNDRNMHYLGREYMYHGEWDKCIRTLKRHLEMPSAAWRDERCASMRYIARAYGERGNVYEQESYLMRAAGEAPYLREPWMDIARFAYQMTQWPMLLFACERALRIFDRPRTYITEADSYGALPWDLLAVACYHLGMKSRALEAVNNAITLEPENERLRENKRFIEQM